MIVDDYIQLYGSGAGISGYDPAEVTVSRDKFGAVKKATIATLGAEAVGGTVNGKTFVGGFKTKAVSIDSKTLPF